MKKLLNLLTIFIFIFLVSACSCKDNSDEEVNKSTVLIPMQDAYLSKDINGEKTSVYPFNTTISLVYFYQSEGERAQEYFKSEYSRLHQLFDRHYYYFDSEGNLINNLRVVNESNGEAIVVDQDLIDIFKEGIRFTKLSKGKFNIGVGELTTLWDEYISIGDPTLSPSSEEINSALICTPNYENIEDIIVVNDDNNTITINNIDGCNGKVSITLGALAKSYAAEKISNDDRLKSGNFLINAGQSTIKIIGDNLSRESGDWGVGITDSYLVYSQNNNYASYLMTLKDPTSVSTSSGDTNHYWYGNHYYHHIIDPISGYPNENRFAITAVGSNAMYMDIITTSLMSMNMEESKEFVRTLINNNIDLELFIQDKKDTSVIVYATSNMKNWVSIRNLASLQEYLDSIVIEDFNYDS